MQVGEILVGQTSGARAVVKDRRLLSDNVGNLQGTFFIPSPKNDANPRWSTGTRSFRFTTSETNSRTVGQVDSSADTNIPQQEHFKPLEKIFLQLEMLKLFVILLLKKELFITTRTETRQIGWYDPLAQSFMLKKKVVYSFLC